MWEHSKSYYTFHRCITYVFSFIIHFRVSHTLALCIRYLARRLFIRELLMFSIMNKHKGHTFIVNEMNVMNNDINILPPCLLS